MEWNEMKWMKEMFSVDQVVRCRGIYLHVLLANVWTNSLNKKQDDSEGDTVSKQPNNSRNDMVVASLIISTSLL